MINPDGDRRPGPGGSRRGPSVAAIGALLLLGYALPGPRVRAGAPPRTRPRERVGRIIFKGRISGRHKAFLLQQVLHSREGGPLDRRRLDADLVRINNTGRFKALKLELVNPQPLPGGMLRYDILITAHETDMVVEVHFPGARRLEPEDDLMIGRLVWKGPLDYKVEPAEGGSRTVKLHMLRSRVGRPYSRTNALLDEAELLDYYHREGFLYAAVRHTTEPALAGGLILSFHIWEGPKGSMKAVHLIGNDKSDPKFADSALRGLMRHTKLQGFFW